MAEGHKDEKRSGSGRVESHVRGLDATGGQGPHSHVESRRVRSDARDCVAGRNVEESWKA